MTEMFERHQEQCSEGWCLSRVIDCQAFLVLVATWGCLNIYSLIWLVRTRHRTTRALRHHLHLGRTPHSSGVEEGSGRVSSPSLDSSCSFGSWTYRFQRCVGRCFACRRRSATSTSCLPTSQSLVGSHEDMSHYSQALGESPLAETTDGSSQALGAAGGTRLRSKPAPLNMCSTFGAGCGSNQTFPMPGFCTSGSSPSSPSNTQHRIQTRSCPSTPTASCRGHPPPSASAVESPLGAMGFRILSASAKGRQLGRK